MNDWVKFNDNLWLPYLPLLSLGVRRNVRWLLTGVIRTFLLLQRACTFVLPKASKKKLKRNLQQLKTLKKLTALI